MSEEEKFSFEEVKDLSNILRILKASKQAINEGNPLELKKLSNETIHSASVHQDSANIIVAVLVYSLSKIFERDNYKEMTGWKEFYNALIRDLNLMIKAGEANDSKKMVDYAGEIRHSLNKIDNGLGMYIKDVFRKAEINKAFKLYEHGLSSQQTADLLGITLWDLSSYIGQSFVGEAKVGISIPEKERIKFAEDFFR